MFWSLCFIFSSVSCSNILIWNPAIGQSHINFLGNIGDLFADDGHNVTIVSPIEDETLTPFGCRCNPSIKKIIYRSPLQKTGAIAQMSIKTTEFWSRPISRNTWDAETTARFKEATMLTYKGLLRDNDFLQSLRDSHFDLAVSEMYHLGDIGLFELLGIKTSMVGAALGAVSHYSELTGLPHFPSFIPSWVTIYDEEMSFLERLHVFFIHIFSSRDDAAGREAFTALFREVYPDFPDLLDVMKKQVGIVLSNVNEFTESPRPTTAFCQYVGGSNVQKPQPLSPEFDQLLDKRPQTVLISFGTFIQSCRMPLRLKEEILSTFGDFSDVTFIWKYERCENDTTYFSGYPNVVPREWIPQNDLLGDPRVSGFITHAGMNSMIELAFHGKPAVTIPLFADQYVNAKNSVRRGLSVLIERTSISKSTLTAALEEILSPNSEIAKNTKKVAEVLKGRDEEYRRAIQKWGRLLAKHGKFEHLTLPTEHLNLLQLYSIDCILFILAILATSVYISFKVLLFIFSLFKIRRMKEKRQ